MIKKQKLTTAIVGKKALAEKMFNNLKKKRVQLSKLNVEIMIDEMLEEIKKILVKGEEIRFLNYFSLKTVVSKSRMGMNLKTGKKMNIPAKRVPKIKFADNLRKEISGVKVKK